MTRVSGLGTGQRNDWATPPEIFAALGCRFDLDVAAPADGPLHVPCDRWLSSDSLQTEWLGFVWMNPPFGGRNGISPWLDKFLAHGNGIALTPDRASAPWFQANYRRATAILFTPKTPFLFPNGERGGNPAFGNALWAVGGLAVEAIHRAERGGFGVMSFPQKRFMSRESAMLPVRLADGRIGSADPEIASIVQALNDAGLQTIASCSGHGFRPGTIALRDGREIIIARSYDEARDIGRLFPNDINGAAA